VEGSVLTESCFHKALVNLETNVAPLSETMAPGSPKLGKTLVM